MLTVCPGAIRTPFFDGEALERLPSAARRAMVEPGPLVAAILKALARGATDAEVAGARAGSARRSGPPPRGV